MIGPFLSPCRLRRLQRQRGSQRRRRLRPSSISPLHPFLFFLFPSVQLNLPSPSFSLSPSFPFFPLFQQVPRPRRSHHNPSPEEYFYQQFCKYWFRFLAQKRKCERWGFSNGVLLSRPQHERCAKAALQFCLWSFFFLLICFYFVLTDSPVSWGIEPVCVCVYVCVRVCVCVLVSNYVLILEFLPSLKFFF